MKKQEKKNKQCPPAFNNVFKQVRKLTLAFNLRASVKILVFLTAAFTLTFFLTRSGTTSAQKKDSCLSCHSSLEARLSEPVNLFEHDIHRARGLSCNDCHGGDPTLDDKNASKDPLKGYIGKPGIRDIPAFCGKCHSDPILMRKFNPSLRVDQVQEYFTSVHGERLRAGDQKVATCVSCHNVHGIRSPGDALSSVYPMNVAETCAKCHSDAARMQDYKIPHDQYNKYKASVHAKALYEKQDLSAPTCNDCHGNHGAVPPGITSVANVCGQCHTRQSTLFQNSPHKAAFEKRQIAECLVCHSNHDIMPPSTKMVGTGEGSVCISCHTADNGFAVAGRIRARMDELQNRIHHAKEILERAERAGMEVSRPTFELRDAVDNLTQARVLVHTVSLDEIESAVVPGMEVAAKSYEAGEAAFVELNFRRSGLIVSLVFILFLALLVYLKIRQLESEEPVTE
jgi:predicted CXXCH cytochrome family protein